MSSIFKLYPSGIQLISLNGFLNVYGGKILYELNGKAISELFNTFDFVFNCANVK